MLSMELSYLATRLNVVELPDVYPKILILIQKAGAKDLCPPRCGDNSALMVSKENLENTQSLTMTM